MKNKSSIDTTGLASDKQSVRTKDELRTELAAIEHERWADWQKWVHSLMIRRKVDKDWYMCIREDHVKWWERQIATPYSGLTPLEQKSDMEQVDRYWHLIEEYVASEVSKTTERANTEPKRELAHTPTALSSIDEILDRIFAYGIDWTEYKDKSDQDHDVSTYAGKIKSELKASLKQSLEAHIAEHYVPKAEVKGQG